MISKTRYLLIIGFILSLTWDLILKIYMDISFLSGNSNYSYLGDIRVPGSLLVTVWILQTVIIILGSYGILVIEIKDFIPNKFKNNKKIPLTYVCADCETFHPLLADSINIKKNELIKFCPSCKKTQVTKKIKITSFKPDITYEILGE